MSGLFPPRPNTFLAETPLSAPYAPSFDPSTLASLAKQLNKLKQSVLVLPRQVALLLRSRQAIEQALAICNRALLPFVRKHFSSDHGLGTKLLACIPQGQEHLDVYSLRVADQMVFFESCWTTTPTNASPRERTRIPFCFAFAHHSSSDPSSSGLASAS